MILIYKVFDHSHKFGLRLLLETMFGDTLLQFTYKRNVLFMFFLSQFACCILF